MTGNYSCLAAKFHLHRSIGFHLVVYSFNSYWIHLLGSLEFQNFTVFQYSIVHSTAKTSQIDTCQNGLQCLFKKQESKVLLWLNFIGYSRARLYCVYWTRPSQSVPPNLRPIGSQTIEYSGLSCTFPLCWISCVSFYKIDLCISGAVVHPYHPFCHRLVGLFLDGRWTCSGQVKQNALIDENLFLCLFSDIN